MEVIESQKKRLGTKRGFVAVKPNCSIQSYAPVLTAWMEFEPEEVVATTYQAISGAGKTFQDWPEMAGNIIPYIGGEEEKSEKEPLRIWGKVENGAIVPADGPVITCQCIIVIGQAAEFDYAGTQACRSLKEEGVEVVLVNSNPATIMTDKDIADQVYIEPLTTKILEKIILKERPDSVLPTLGGQ